MDHEPDADRPADYLPGARVLVGFTRKSGEVRRVFEQNGRWKYDVVLDTDNRLVTVTTTELRSASANR